jgi:hypothetical protein
VGCFFLGKQKVVLFPKYRENGWEAAASALTSPLFPRLAFLFEERATFEHFY